MIGMRTTDRISHKKRAVCGIILAALIFMFCSCGEEPKVSVASSDGAGPAVSSEEVVSAKHQHQDPMKRLAGTYYIDGDTTAAYVTVSEDGSFAAFYASGTEELRGTVRYQQDDSDSGLNVYVFYTEEGKPYMGVVDTGENKISGFETGNGSFRYVRVG